MDSKCKMRSKYLIVFCGALVIIFYNMQNYQHEELMLEQRTHPFDSIMERNKGRQHLLAMPVGLHRKRSVHSIVSKFISENFTVILFHYDGNVDDWHHLKWSKSVIHISAINQTKWWFAKRFLHPDVVSKYDYIFIWDENAQVKNFLPARYVNVMKSDGLEVSHPALDSKFLEMYHQISIRRKNGIFHRITYKDEGSGNCYIPEEPTCSRWVEASVVVFSNSAWKCAWHHIQGDDVNGWGFDFKFGYCPQVNSNGKNSEG